MFEGIIFFIKSQALLLAVLIPLAVAVLVKGDFDDVTNLEVVVVLLVGFEVEHSAFSLILEFRVEAAEGDSEAVPQPATLAALVDDLDRHHDFRGRDKLDGVAHV